MLRIPKKSFDNQQSRTQQKLLFESITRASGEQIKTIALRVEQTASNTYDNNNPDALKDVLFKTLDQQLVRIASKKIANHKSTGAANSIRSFSGKNRQEDILRTQNDWTQDKHKLYSLIVYKYYIYRSRQSHSRRYPNYGTQYRIWDHYSKTRVVKRTSLKKKPLILRKCK